MESLNILTKQKEKMYQKKFSKARLQLFSSFAAITLMMVILSMRAWVSFSSMEDFMSTVVERDMRISVLVYQLAEKEGSIATSLFPLYSADTNERRETLYQSIIKLHQETSHILDQIGEKAYQNKIIYQDLAEHTEKGFSNVTKLNDIIKKSLALEQEINAAIQKKQKEQLVILEMVAPFIDGANYELSLAILQKNGNTREQTYLLHRSLYNLMQVQTQISLSQGILFEMGETDNIFDIQPLSEKFIAVSHHALVGAKLLGERSAYAPLFKAVRDYYGNILDKNNNIFELKKTLLEYKDDAQQALKEGASTTQKVLSLVGEVTKDMENKASNLAGFSKKQFAQEKKILIIMDCFALLCAFIIAWVYSRHTLHFQKKLMQEVMEREKTQNELAKEKEKAEESSRVKSEFLAVMSHEIRTPMNSIVGFSSLLLKEPLSEKLKHYAHTIYESADALSIILEDILIFTKLESNKVKIESIPLDFRKIIQDVIILFKQKAEEKGIFLHVEIDEKMPFYILGDPGRLRQIIINLVSNAIKFTEKGGITIIVKLEHDKECLITVKDTGIGISEKNKKRLFQKFEQADTSTTRKYGGIGLGLAITKKLINLMGGDIAVKSVVGKGSQFYFNLPFIESSSSAFEKATPTSELQKIGSISKDKTVLVAEDNPFNQALIGEILKQIGYPYKIVSTGKEAVETLKKSPFDLVFMDMQMPVMGGIEAATVIRKSKGPINAIPIIALSANALEEDVQKCLEAGMQGHIEKPIDRVKLENILHKYLEVNIVKKPEPQKKNK